MKLAYPIDKVLVTQRFGENPAIYSQFGMKGHNGVDFRTRFIDSPLGHRYITAAADGMVIEINTNPALSGYGIFVRLQHVDGSQTLYGHLAKPYVFPKQNVKAGARIGLSDNTGFSTGPHLHFGYRPAGWEQNLNNGFKGYADPLPLFA